MPKDMKAGEDVAKGYRVLSTGYEDGAGDDESKPNGKDGSEAEEAAEKDEG